MANTPTKADDCDIFDDVEGRDTKNKIVRSMRFETFLNSISKVASFAAGPVFGAGAVMAMQAFVGHAATTAVAATAASAGATATAATGVAGGIAAGLGTSAAVGMGFSALLTGGAIALGIVAVGALLMSAAVAADFVSTRIYQDKQLDMQEFNAKRAGHHIVNELKAQKMLFSQEAQAPEPSTTDWGKRVGGPRAMDASMTQRLEAQRAAEIQRAAEAQAVRSVA